MNVHSKVTEKRIISAVKRDDGTGFCIVCGGSQRFVEPDAEQYPCARKRCPSHTEPRANTNANGDIVSNAYIHGSVYGAEQLLLMGVA